MQKSAARICCAFLLMGIALASSAGLMGAVFAENEAPPQQQTQAPPAETEPETEGTLVLVRMLFLADAEVRQIQIYDEAGQHLQTLFTDAEGVAVSGNLSPGCYRAETELGSATFTLHDNASVTADSGLCWSDGEQLHLTSAETGTVTVRRTLRPEELAEGWLDYTLSGGDYYGREVLRRSAEGDVTLSCTFYGVPEGTYVLSENGVPCSGATLTGDQMDVTVVLAP